MEPVIAFFVIAILVVATIILIARQKPDKPRRLTFQEHLKTGATDHSAYCPKIRKMENALGEIQYELYNFHGCIYFYNMPPPSVKLAYTDLEEAKAKRDELERKFLAGIWKPATKVVALSERDMRNIVGKRTEPSLQFIMGQKCDTEHGSVMGRIIYLHDHYILVKEDNTRTLISGIVAGWFPICTKCEDDLKEGDHVALKGKILTGEYCGDKYKTIIIDGISLIASDKEPTYFSCGCSVGKDLQWDIDGSDD